MSLRHSAELLLVVLLLNVWALVTVALVKAWGPLPGYISAGLFVALVIAWVVWQYIDRPPWRRH